MSVYSPTAVGDKTTKPSGPEHPLIKKHTGIRQVKLVKYLVLGVKNHKGRIEV